ncbi:MAG: site-2 protease family protein [Pirellulales bacterium]|nr:site-2 protease family protein [Pirellulales bacterium]
MDRLLMTLPPVMEHHSQPTEPSAATVRVALDPSVAFSRRDIGGQTSYVAHHRELGSYFRFGAEEYRIAQLLDGSNGINDIVQALQAEGLKWNARDVRDFLVQLVAARLATTTESVANNRAQSSRQGEPQSPPAKLPASLPAKLPSGARCWQAYLLKSLSLMVSQRIPLFSGDDLAQRLDDKIGWLFDRAGIGAWCGLVASGLLIVYSHADDFALEVRRMFNPAIWLVLIVMWCVSKVIHELGHAVAARHHDVKVGRFGIMFFLFAPLAYVDVTDAWKLRSRWQRVQIALAGVYLELMVASIAAWAWWLFPPAGIAQHLAAQFFLIAGPATLLVNANPLLRLDGYYVLSDISEIPNLRMHGRRQLGANFEWWLFRIPRPESLLSGWRKRLASWHAAGSVVFQFFWMSGLIIAVSLWARGLGVMLGIAAALLWGVFPLLRWVYKIWTADPANERWGLNRKRRRLISYALLLIMVGHYLCTASSPLARRVPVVVQFRDEQIARAASDAFVQDVFVFRGQRVERGAPLLVLDDPDLRLKRDQKADDLELASMRAVQFRRQGELARAASETEKAESLRRQLAELDQRLSGLHVVAKRAGVVVGAKLDRLQGSFVSSGEELLRVSDPQEKELLAAVSESDMQAYQEAAHRRLPATVRLRGGIQLTAIPEPLRPQFRCCLPHPALAATVGGPLAVEPVPGSDDEMRSVQPQLQSITRLDPITSAEVRCGQVGMMIISDNRSLATRLLDAAFGELK